MSSNYLAEKINDNGNTYTSCILQHAYHLKVRKTVVKNCTPEWHIKCYKVNCLQEWAEKSEYSDENSVTSGSYRTPIGPTVQQLL